MLFARIVVSVLGLLRGAYPASADQQHLIVLAAASLREPFTAIARKYENARSGAHVELSFAGSQQLEAQLALGASADVFASADRAQMEKAVAARRVDEQNVRTLATNYLALVCSTRAAAKIRSIADIGNPSLKLVLAASQVPVGHYSLQLLQNVAKEQPKDWAARVKANVVSHELDVRAVLAKVELGDADAGIVYETDARSARGKVVSRAIPNRLNVHSAYYIAPIKGSELGASFVSLVLSREGRQTLKAAGFGPPRP